jgi:hypothetical protein
MGRIYEFFSHISSTGTCDVPENFSANFAENPVRIHKNIVKFGKEENCLIKKRNKRKSL